MLKLPRIFTDHMVLQRQKNILVWGETDKSLVQVTLAGLKAVAKVNQDGHFEVQLDSLEASGPYEMVVDAFDEEVELKNPNHDQVIYKDIMIGEVWLAGGQSNMEFELQNAVGGKEELENKEDLPIRYYYVPKVPYVGDELLEAEANISWELFSKENSAKWSAVAYYFAKNISSELNVTVGIIGCNWGGTSASCWVSREYLEKEPSLSSYLEEYDEATKNQDLDEYLKALKAYEIYQGEFDKNVGNYYATAEHPTWDEAIRLFGENQYPGPQGPRSFYRPYGLYESMLSRITPYTLGGIIYYQGEEDDHKPFTYDVLLTTLIKQWRHDFRDEALPFMNVQLPMFSNDGEEDYKNWPLIREAQKKVYDTVPGTGLAVILDLGEYGNIHPVDKKPVGKRLALQALYHVFNKASKQEAEAAAYESHEVVGSTMTIKFKNAEGGLVLSNDTKVTGSEPAGEGKITGFELAGDDKITGFELAGDDKVFYKAEASIVSDSGDSIIVTSDKVAKPVYARYNWTNYAPVTLYGANKLPVVPFRTSQDDGATFTGSRQG